MIDSSKKILLVEDNSNDELLTIRSLKKNNISNEIIVARDGVEALDFLFSMDEAKKKYANKLPQVVLLDLNLPKVSGMEVLKRIRSTRRTKCLPVVVLTSSQEEDDLVESYNLGVNSYIQKPVDFKDFTKAVQQLGLYWLLLNKTPPECRASLFVD